MCSIMYSDGARTSVIIIIIIIYFNVFFFKFILKNSIATNYSLLVKPRNTERGKCCGSDVLVTCNYIIKLMIFARGTSTPPCRYYFC